VAECCSRVKPTLLVPVLALLAGCASKTPIEGQVRLGHIAAVNGPRVRADKVIEDSRCPIDAQCDWAGRLIVLTTILGGGWSKQFDLALGILANVADDSLTLVTAMPLRRLAGGATSPYPTALRSNSKAGHDRSQGTIPATVVGHRPDPPRNVQRCLAASQNRFSFMLVVCAEGAQADQALHSAEVGCGP
jgi:hypothetical protein